MSLTRCSRSEDLRQVLLLGHWPNACEQELREHVTTCPHCSSTVLVTQHLHSARAETMRSAPADSANLLWLRAQARRRQAALERANRPIAWAQLFALLLGLLGGAALIARQLSRISAPQTASVSAHSVLAPLLSADSWTLELLIIPIAILLLLGGVALYLTSERRDRI